MYVKPYYRFAGFNFNRLAIWVGIADRLLTGVYIAPLNAYRGLRHANASVCGMPTPGATAGRT